MRLEAGGLEIVPCLLDNKVRVFLSRQTLQGRRTRPLSRGELTGGGEHESGTAPHRSAPSALGHVGSLKRGRIKRDRAYPLSVLLVRTLTCARHHPRSQRR